MANVITNGGRALTTARLMGSGAEPKNIGIGTGAGTSTVTDTTLFGEVNPAGASTGSRTAGTSAQATTAVANDTYKVTGSVTATAQITVTNAGLWDNTAIGSGNLFMKGDFATAAALNAGDTLALTASAQYA